MKKRILFIFLLVLVMFFALTACGGSGSNGGNSTPEQSQTPPSLKELKGITLKDASFTYDGQPHSLEITGDLPSGIIVKYENNEQINAGEYTVTASFEDSKGRYDTSKKLTAKLTINKKDITGIYFNDGEFIYDGSVHSLNITGDLPKGVNVIYTGNDKTNPGSYEVTASFIDTTGNYNVPNDMTATLKITEKSQTTNIKFEDLETTYDGSVKSLQVENLPKGVTVDYINNDKVNTGTYTVTAILTDTTGTYDIPSHLIATLKINKAKLSVNFDDLTVEYDGQPHSIYLEDTLPDGVYVTYIGNKEVEPGTYTVRAIITDATGNYEVNSSYTATLTILAPDYTDLDITINNDDFIFTYNTPYEWSISLNDPRVGKENLVIEYYNANNNKIDKPTDVGTYYVLFKYEQNDELYINSTSLRQEFEITSYKLSKPTVNTSKVYTYNGLEQEVELIGFDSDYMTIISGNSGIDAGTYEVEIVLNPNCEWIDVNTTIEWEIEKLEIEVIFEDGVGLYDGQSHSIYLDTILPEGVTVEYEGNGQVRPGTYTVTAIITDTTGNYRVSNVSATLTILAPDYTDLDIILNDFYGSFIYGDAYSFDITLSDFRVSVEDIIITYYDFDNNEIEKPMNAGKYFVEFKYEQNDELFINKALLREEFRIVPRLIDKPTVISAHVYNGLEQEVALNGFDESIMTILSGNKGTNVGIYTLEIELDSNYEWMNPNQEINWEIRQQEIAVIFNDAVISYDGLEHSIYIENELPDGVNVEYEGNGQVRPGTYVVTATITDKTGNYNIVETISAVLTILAPDYTNLDILLNNPTQSFTYGMPVVWYISFNDIRVSVDDLVITYYDLNHNEIEKPINVGKYFVEFKYEENDELFINEAMLLEYFEITPCLVRKPIVISTYTYNGLEQEVELSGFDSSYMTIISGNKGINAGTYTVEIELDSNYEWMSPYQEINWEIKKQKLDVVFKDKGIDYDGYSHSIYLDTILPEGVTVEYVGNGETKPGTYMVTAYITDTTGNYDVVTTITALYTIIPPEYTAFEIYLNNHNFTYGEEIILDITVSDPRVSIDELIIQYVDENGNEIEKPTSVGTYNIQISYKENHELFITNVVMTTTITIMPIYVEKPTIVSTHTYNGLEQEVELSGFDSSYMTIISGNKGIDAGIYTVEIELDPNYEWMSPYQEINWEIEKQKLDVVFNDKVTDYDGDCHSIYLDTMLPEGVIVEYVGNEQTKPGTYPVTAYITDTTGNYDVITTITAILTINRPEYSNLEIKIDELMLVFVYGEEYNFIVTLNDSRVSLDDLIVKYYDVYNMEITKPVDAGTYYVEYSYEQNDELFINKTVVRKEFRIVRRLVEKPTIVSTHTYNGLEQEVELSGFDSSYMTIISGNKGIDAGTYTVEIELDPNYEWMNYFDSITWEIKQQEIAVIFNDAVISYDGLKHSIYIENELPEGITVDYFENNKTQPGTYQVTAIFTNYTTNYSIVSLFSATMEIVKDGKYHDVTINDENGNSYTVVLPNGSTDIELPEITQKPGYNGYWDYDNSAITSDTSISVKYDLIEFTISYFVDGVEVTLDEESFTVEKYIEFDDYNPGFGKVFVGWYTTPTFDEGTLIYTTDYVYNDLVLYAKVIKSDIEDFKGLEVDENHEINITKSANDQYIYFLDLVTVSPGSNILVSNEYFERYENLTYSFEHAYTSVGYNYFYLYVCYNFEFTATYKLVIYQKSYYNITLVNNFTDTIFNRQAEEGSYFDNSDLIQPYEGHEFIGWREEGKEEVSKDTFVAYDGITFYAVYEKKEYTLTFDLNGGYGLEETTLKVKYCDEVSLPIPTKDGYIFGGWWFENMTHFDYIIYHYDEDITITAIWESSTYSITYDYGIGSIMDNPLSYQKGEEHIIKNPNATGYTFIGWSVNDSLELVTNFEITPETVGDIKLVANFEANKYTIYYKLNDNNGSDLIEQIVTYNEEFELLVPTREGYNFIEWQLVGTRFEDLTYTFAYDIFLEAIWEGGEHTITFDHGHDGIKDVFSVKYGEMVYITFPYRPGYEFKYWEYNGEVFESSIYLYEENITVKAIWEAKTYFIHYDYKYDNLLEVQEVTYDSEFTLLEISRLGYEFVSWTLNDEEFYSGIWNYETDIYLQATWVSNGYTITYLDTTPVSTLYLYDNYSGEVVKNDYQIKDYIVEYPTPFEREGYLFTGWYLEPTCETLFDFSGELNGELSLFAGWKAYAAEAVLNENNNATVYCSGTTIKYIAFVPLKSSYITVRTNGSLDTYGYLYDSNKNQLISDDDSGADRNFTYNYHVEKGQLYYIGVRFYSSGNSNVTVYVSDLEIPTSTLLVTQSDNYHQGLTYIENVLYDQHYDLFAPLRYGYEFVEWQLNGERFDESGIWNIASDITLTPIWKARNYTISLELLGGECDVTEIPVVFDQEFKLPTPERLGYKFKYWDYACDVVEDGIYNFDSDITLNATWELLSYNIDYKLNGGTIPGVVRNVYTIESSYELATPSKTGYTFEYWVVNGENVGKEYILGNGTVVNLTIEAIFTPNNYQITLQYNDGVKEDSYIDVTYDDTFELPQPERIGYEFKGWKYDYNTTVESGIYNYERDITLTAEWEIITYEVSYSYNGAENWDTYPTLYSVEDNILLPTPYKTGYTFEYWIVNGENVGKEYILGNGTVGNLTIEAIFTPNNYQITLQYNDGVTADSYIDVTYDDTFELPQPERIGYEFKGWLYNGELFTENVYKYAHNIELTSEWHIITYEVSYVFNGAENWDTYPTLYSVEDNILLPTPYKTGYTFEYWLVNGENVGKEYILGNGTVGNLTIEAIFTPIEYIITLENYDAVIEFCDIKVLYDEIIELPTPTKLGYELKGWLYNGELFTETVYKYTYNIALVANWEIITYEVSYSYNGAQNWQDYPTLYSVEDNILLPTPYKTGYTFEYWLVNGENVGKEYILGNGTVGNLTIEAIFTPNEYQITLQYNDGVTADSYIDVTYDEEFELPIPQLGGYSFGGWYYGEVLFEEDTYQHACDITLVARWEISNNEIIYNNIAYGVNVTYDLNYDGLTINEVYLNGDTISYPSEPKRQGYLFSGWFTEPECQNLFVFSGETDSITLYAGWIEATSDYVFNDNHVDTDIVGKNIKYIAFVALTSGNVTIYSSSDKDTYGYLYDSNKNQLASNDDSGSGSNFQISYSVEVGQLYYVGVRYFSDSNKGIIPVHIEVSTSSYSMVANGNSFVYSEGSSYNISIAYGDEFTLIEPARNGYTFNGWYYNNELIESGIYDYLSNLVLEARWNANNYQITLDYNDDVTENSYIDVTYNESFELPVPSNFGYDFVGWYYEDELVEECIYAFARDITLTAKWQVWTNISYQVNHYVENSETLEFDLFVVDNFVGDAFAKVKPSVYTYDDHVSPEIVEVTINPDGSTVVNYYYYLVRYNINIVGNGGNDVTVSYRVGEVINLDGLTNRDNFTFGGLYIDINLTEEFSLTNMIAENITLYAYWLEENKPADFNYEKDSQYINSGYRYYYSINEYYGDSNVVVIPSFIGGLAVESIRDTFQYNSTVENVIIGENVRKIDHYAFYECTSIKTITLPSTLERIEFTAFMYARNLETVYYNVDLSNYLEMYLAGNPGEYASHIYILDENNEWYDLKTITELDLSEITYIDEEALAYLPNLKKVILSSNLEYLGSSPFSNSNITEIYYNGTILDLVSIEGNGSIFTNIENVYILDENNEYVCNPEKITIPGSVKKIENNSFYQATFLKEVIIEEGVVEIGNQAFSYCTNLDSIILPNSIKTIGSEAFKHCESLKCIEIPEGVTNLSNAFDDCYDLTYIILPSSITEFSYYNIDSCDKLGMILYRGNEEDLVIIDNTSSTFNNLEIICNYDSGIKIVKNEKYSYLELENRIYNLSVLDKNIETFNGNDFVDYDVISFSNGAFMNLTKLKTVDLSSFTITVLPKNAFSGCGLLTKVILPETLVEIGNYAFYSCYYLNEIELPNSVTTIGYGAFSYCTSLTDILLPEGLEIINFYAFSESGLRGVKIPENVKDLENYNYIFRYARNLKYIILPSTITQFNLENIYCCDNLMYIIYEGNEGELEFTQIDSYGYLLDNVSIEYMTDYEIGYINNDTYSYFVYNGLIYDLFINDDTITTFDLSDFEGYEIVNFKDYAFGGCEYLESIDLSSLTIKSIPLGMFRGCSLLKEVTLPETVEVIEAYAFAECVKLTHISLPNGLKEIVAYAFNECDRLMSVKLPYTLESIHSYSFLGCDYLYEVYNSSFLSVNNCFPNAKVIHTFLGGDSILYHVDGGYHFYRQEDMYYLFLYDGDGGHIVLPEAVNGSSYIIEKYVFAYNDDILSVVVSSGVLEIYDYAFRDCYNLYEIYNYSSIEITNDYWTNGGIGAYAIYIYSYSANSNYITIGDFEFIYKDENYYLVKYRGNDEHVILPEKVNGCYYIVGPYAFTNNTSMKSITLSEYIIAFKGEAFAGCKNLVDVYFNGTIEKWCNIDIEGLDSSPMYYGKNFYYFEQLHQEITLLTYLVIPEHVTEVKRYQFASFDCIEYLWLSVAEKLGHYAFYECTSLKEVTFTNNLKECEYGAFANCTSLYYFETPYNLTQIYDAMFYNCQSLKNFTFHNNITVIGNEAFRSTGFEELVIPSRVCEIGQYAFLSCVNLREVSFESDYISSIDYWAFAWCYSLEKITLPKYVNEMGDGVFYDCSRLTIYVDYSGNYYNWTNYNPNNRPIIYILSDIKLESERVVFDGFEHSLTISGNIPNDMNVYYYDNLHTEIGTYEVIVRLEDPTGQYLFTEELTATLEIYNDGSILMDNTFDYTVTNGFATLTKYNGNDECVIVPSKIWLDGTMIPVTKIGESLFEDNCTVKEVVISEGITEIGQYAFYYSENLEKLTIPSTIEKFDYDALYKCEKLNEVYYNASLTDWCNITFVNYYANPLYYTENLYMLNEDGSSYDLLDSETLTIPSDVETISKYAFTFSSFTELYIPDSVKTISDYAFYCSKLENVYIEEGLETIGDHAFDGANSLTSINLPNTLVAIYEQAFYACRELKTITIPSSVEYIGSDVFAQCNNLTIYCEDYEKPSGWKNSWYGSASVVWAPRQYDILYNDAAYGATITYDYQFDDLVLTETYLNGESISYPEIPYRYGYIFKGWYTDLSYQNGFDFTGELTGSITLYACWVEYNSEFEFDCNSSYAYIYCDETSYIAFIPHKDCEITIYSYSDDGYDSYGYLYDSNKNELASDDDSRGNLNFQITYNVLAGQLYYVGVRYLNSNLEAYLNVYIEGLENPNYNMVVSSNELIYCEGASVSLSVNEDTLYELIYPTREGYSLEGLYVNDNLATESSILVTTDMVIDVAWVPKQYQITLMYDDYETENSYLSVLYDQTLELPTPTRYGFDFMGWYLDGYYFEDEVYIYTKDIILVANWEVWHDISYTVNHYVENNDTNEFDLYLSETFTGDAFEVVYPNVYEYDGRISPEIVEVVINPDGSTVVDYYYSLLKYTITVIGNGGNDIIVSYDLGEEIDLDGLTTREGYTFGGLYYDINLTEEFNLTHMIDSSITVYAYWLEENRACDFEYLITTNGGYSIRRYNGSSSTMNVPAYIGGLPVEEIGSYAFQYNFNIERVVIPEGVHTIGYFAFGYAENLRIAILPNSLKNLESDAFGGCYNLQEVYFNGNLSEYLMINSDYLHLSQYATSVYILDDNYGYYDLKNIGELDLTGITHIGNGSLSYLNNLNKLTISNEVEYIGYNAFEGTYVNEFYFDGTIEEWMEIEITGHLGLNYSNFYLLDEFGNYYSISYELVIPEAITVIPAYNLSIFNNVGSIVLHNQITEINSFAFPTSSIDVYYNGTIEEFINIRFSLETSIWDNVMNFFVKNTEDQYEVVNNLTIPSNNDHVPSYIFSGAQFLQKVVIEEGVNVIENNAFTNCSNLEEVILPEGLESINYYAFNNCNNLRKINMPTTLKRIGNNAFNYCSQLEEINLPEGIEYVEYGAFTNTNLKHFTFPSTLTSIGQSLFCYCQNLQMVYIPKEIKTIDASWFVGCTNLGVILYEGSEEELEFINTSWHGNVLNNVEIIYNFNGEIENITTNEYSYLLVDNKIYNLSIIDKGLEVFDASEFEGYEIVSFANDAFKYNNNLTKVDLSGISITSIPQQMFMHCSNLTEVILPNTLISIGYEAFAYCVSLSSIVLPQTLEKIENEAFRDCYSLYEIYNLSSLELYPKTFGHGQVAAYAKAIHASLNEESIYTTVDNDFHFYKENDCYYLYRYTGSANHLVLPDSVNGETYKIMSDTFSGNCDILSVTISSGVVEICDQAFYECRNIKVVYNLSNLEIYPGDWTNGCVALFAQSVYSEIPTESQFITVDDFLFLYDLGQYTLIKYLGNSNNVVLPNDIEGNSYNIGPRFLEGIYLNSLTIPNTISVFSTGMLEGIYGIGSIYYAGSISDWCNIIVEDVSAAPGIFTNEIYIYNESNEFVLMTDVVIPNDITYIGNYQFYQIRSITSVTLPSSVSQIGAHAFAGCYNLTNVSMSNNVSYIGDYAFEGCGNLVNISTLSGVSYVGSYAFSNCISLISLEFSDNLSTIEPYAFHNCRNLTNINIGNKVNYISNCAFSLCLKLEAIYIPETVYYVGECAFTNCFEITIYIDYDADINHWDNNWNHDWNGYDREYIYIVNGLSLESKSFACDGNEHQLLLSGKVPSDIIVDYTNNVHSEIGTYEVTVTLNDPTGNYILAETYFTAVMEIYYAEFSTVTFIDSETNEVIYSGLFEKGVAIRDFSFLNKNGYEIVSELPTDIISEEISFFVTYELIIYNITYIHSDGQNHINNVYQYTILDTVTLYELVDLYEGNEFYGWYLDENYQNVMPQSFSGYYGNLVLYAKIDSAGYIVNYYVNDELVESQFYYNGDWLSTITYQVDEYCSVNNWACYDSNNELTIYSGFVSNDTNEDLNVYAYEYRYEKNGVGYQVYDKRFQTESEELTATILYVDRLSDRIEYDETLNILGTEYKVTEIGSGSFEGSIVDTIIISKNIKHIGISAFSGCQNLTNVYFKGTIAEWCEINFENWISNPLAINKGNLYILNENDEYELLTDLVIPEGVKSVGQYAFDNYTNLSTVILNDGLEEIEASAFYGCSNLTSIVIPSSLKTIGSQAFYKCYALAKVYFNGTLEEWKNAKYGDLILSNSDTELYYLNENGEYVKYGINIELYDGAKIILAYNNVVMSGYGNSIITVTEVESALDSDIAIVITLFKSGDYWYLYTEDYGYIYYDNEVGGNKVSMGDVTDSSALWTITMNNDKAIISNVNNPDRILQYNASSPRFACYTSSQIKPTLHIVG